MNCHVNVKPKETSRATKSGTPAALIVALLVAVAAILGGCAPSGTPNPGGSAPVTVSEEPEKADIIRAVRNHVEGKTYTDVEYRQEPETKYCTESDVALEKTFCSEVGDSYPGWRTIPESVTRTCESLSVDDSAWSVAENGVDQWRVSLSGSAWEVKKLDGGSASVDLGVITERVAGFTFSIEAYQDC